MFKRFRENKKFRQEIDNDALYRQAVEWTKANFKKRGVPNWTSEYQNTFAVHTLKYCQAYKAAYVKRRRAEEAAKTANV